MIVYGKNVICEVVKNKHEIYKLYLDNKFRDKKYLNFLKSNNIYYTQLAKDKLNELSQNKPHQGIVADIRPYKTYSLSELLSLDDKPKRFIILDSITDPQNLGSIIRTAHATKMTGIIYAKKEQVSLSGVVAKASSGAIEYIKIAVVSNLNNTLIELKKKNVIIIASSDSATRLYTELPKDKDVAVILGSEGAGVRKILMRNADMLVAIPTYGKISSLNVGVAGALLMYELIRK